MMAAAAADIVVLKEKNAAAAQIGNVRTDTHTHTCLCLLMIDIYADDDVHHIGNVLDKKKWANGSEMDHQL